MTCNMNLNTSERKRHIEKELLNLNMETLHYLHANLTEVINSSEIYFSEINQKKIFNAALKKEIE